MAMDASGGPQREAWGSKAAFVLAAAGSAIGLGNIWGFPTVAANNGGAAFLVVYLCAVAFIGAPVMLAELILGRKSQRNPVGAFKAIMPRLELVARRRPRRADGPDDPQLLLGDRRVDARLHPQDRDRRIRGGGRHRRDLHGRRGESVAGPVLARDLHADHRRRGREGREGRDRALDEDPHADAVRDPRAARPARDHAVGRAAAGWPSTCTPTSAP